MSSSRLFFKKLHRVLRFDSYPILMVTCAVRRPEWPDSAGELTNTCVPLTSANRRWKRFTSSLRHANSRELPGEDAGQGRALWLQYHFERPRVRLRSETSPASSGQSRQPVSARRATRTPVQWGVHLGSQQVCFRVLEFVVLLLERPPRGVDILHHRAHPVVGARRKFGQALVLVLAREVVLLRSFEYKPRRLRPLCGAVLPEERPSPPSRSPAGTAAIRAGPRGFQPRRDQRAVEIGDPGLSALKLELRPIDRAF